MTQETGEAAEADQPEEEAAEAAAPPPAMADGDYPVTDSLNCSSGENTLVYELYNYGEPYPACLSDSSA